MGKGRGIGNVVGVAFPALSDPCIVGVVLRMTSGGTAGIRGACACRRCAMTLVAVVAGCAAVCKVGTAPLWCIAFEMAVDIGTAAECRDRRLVLEYYGDSAHPVLPGSRRAVDVWRNPYPAIPVFCSETFGTRMTYGAVRRLGIGRLVALMISSDRTCGQFTSSAIKGWHLMTETASNGIGMCIVHTPKGYHGAYCRKQPAYRQA